MSALVVPHASGARVLVDELAITSAWSGILEGVPGERFFEGEMASALARFPRHEARARPIAHPPPEADTWGRPRMQPDVVEERWGPRAPHAPHWIVVAAARAFDGERERAVAFGWFTNALLALSLEEAVVAGMHDIPLDGDVAAHPPDARVASPMFLTKDGATTWLQSLALRFVVEGFPADALAKWAPKAERLPMARGIDEPVLARAAFSGPRIEGARNPDPEEYIDAWLHLAWVAPAPGRAPLSRVVQDALADVAWHTTATPTLGP